MKISEPDRIRALLLGLGDHVRQSVLNARRESDPGDLATISRESIAEASSGKRRRIVAGGASMMDGTYGTHGTDVTETYKSYWSYKSHPVARPRAPEFATG